jgi:hypothetical protein
MNKIYHVKVAWNHYLFLLLLSIPTIYCVWQKHILLSVCCTILLIAAIEKIIHMAYILTPQGELHIYSGHFIKTKIIDLKRISEYNPHFRVRAFIFPVRFILLKFEDKYYYLKAEKMDDLAREIEKEMNE